MKRSIGFEGERFVHIANDELRRIKYSSLMNSLYIHSIGYYYSAEHHYVERLSGANEHILIYCSGGGGTVEIDGESFHLSESQFIIIPPHRPHRYFADRTEPWSIYWAHFLGHSADYFAEAFRYPTTIDECDTSRKEERIDLFEEVFQTLNREGANSDIDAIHYANCCFAHFLATLKYIAIYRSVRSERESSYGDKMVHRLIHYMNENVDRPLTNRDFAEFVSLSESYLYRCFRREMGVAPFNYFLSLKIKKAAQLLTETNLLVKQISQKLGFSDPFYFSKLFRKSMGESPLEYRKNR
ncbi:MAG: AraC family transcriptional regulator [Rikenellaceae bacterium]